MEKLNSDFFYIIEFTGYKVPCGKIFQTYQQASDYIRNQLFILYLDLDNCNRDIEKKSKIQKDQKKKLASVIRCKENNSSPYFQSLQSEIAFLSTSLESLFIKKESIKNQIKLWSK
jgi:hypothetical protein